MPGGKQALRGLDEKPRPVLDCRRIGFPESS
jgi:hypothetical protein